MSDNPDSRHEDYNLIEKGLKSKDSTDVKLAKIAKERLDSESREVRKMREELIEAHRHSDRGKIEELHFKIKERDRYGRK